MADDRMKKDDQRNMGAGGREDQDFGKQAPGRQGQGGGQQGGQQGQQGQQKGSRNIEEDDDEFATGGQGQSGGQNRGGGQNR